jgi:hypothetical protein
MAMSEDSTRKKDTQRTVGGTSAMVASSSKMTPLTHKSSCDHDKQRELPQPHLPPK